MPASTGVVHDAGVPRRPSISTRHRRHEPNGSSESVAHSLGTWMPASIAARITDVPAGALTSMPSIFSVTVCVDSLRGRAEVVVGMGIVQAQHQGSPAAARARQAEVFRVVIQRRQHRERGHAAHRAQAAGDHRVAQVAQQFLLRALQ